MGLQASQRAHVYQEHLDRVSRSFAFCIARLEGRFRFYVGHCYLLFRILDTIEDAPWASGADQVRSFEAFNSFLQNPPSPDHLNPWIEDLVALDLPEGEKLLIAAAGDLLADFHELLGPEVRSTLLRCLQNMSRSPRSLR